MFFWGWITHTLRVQPLNRPFHLMTRKQEIVTLLLTLAAREKGTEMLVLLKHTCFFQFLPKNASV